MKTRSLQSRISMAGAIALGAMALVVIGYGAVMLHRVALADADREVAAVAESKAAEVETTIGVALDTARTIASMVRGARGTTSAAAAAGGAGTVTREQFMAQLRAITAERKGILGTYVGFEPEAYDGRDKDFRKAEGHDETGRFIPYLVRHPDGKLELTPLVDYENADLDDRGQRKGEYYLRPRESKVDCIVDPFDYEIGGQKVLITSLLSPIVEDGKYLGMAGADVELKFVQEMLDKAKVFGGAGKLILVSNKGWVAGMTGQPGMVGKQLKEAAPDLVSALPEIQAGKDGRSSSKGLLTVRRPLVFGECTTPWALVVQVPERLITAAASRTMWSMALLALVCLVAGAAAMGLVARRVAAPVVVSINRMGQASRHVAMAAEQVAAAGSDMAAGASEQASSLEETSASLEQMASMTSQNAESAQQAALVANQAKEAAAAGNTAMRRMVETMDDIQASSNRTAAILKTIDEIAFQTNLLALNAAVEAARAGEAGRGFAVVAEEVRSLAHRSAEASRTTAGLIEESKGRATQGVTASHDVAAALDSIAASVDRVTQLVGEVAGASREQAQGIVQVNQAMTQMDQLTQRMAASTEETASTAEELSAQADEMQGLVGHVREVVTGSATDANAPEPVTLRPTPLRPLPTARPASPAPRPNPPVHALEAVDLDF